MVCINSVNVRFLSQDLHTDTEMTCMTPFISEGCSPCSVRSELGLQVASSSSEHSGSHTKEDIKVPDIKNGEISEAATERTNQTRKLRSSKHRRDISGSSVNIRERSSDVEKPSIDVMHSEINQSSR